MRAYTEGERPSGMMETAVHGLDDAAVPELARWFAALPRGPPWPAAPGARIADGEAIAHGRVPRVPACADCHGPGKGPYNPQYPVLAGQDPGWFAVQMELFRTGRRGGTPLSQLMEVVAAHGLDDEQVRDVAAYYASLP